MIPSICVVGISHKNTPVEIREKFSFSKSKIPEALTILQSNDYIQECVILSTCNRSEIYAVVDDFFSSKEKIKDFFCKYHCQEMENFVDRFYIYHGKACVEHLFEVASGLDSMIIGENEILGQVKSAYLMAKECNSTGKILNILFQKSLNIGKEVRVNTKISSGRISFSSIAIKLMQNLFSDLKEKTVMILGAGKISELFVRYLASKEVNSIFVSNRSFEKAQEMANICQGKAIRFDNRLKFMKSVDIIISITASPHLVIKKEDVMPLLLQPRQNPVLFIDLAVPRDIDPEIKNLSNVYLYNMDYFQKISEDNLSKRQKEISKCVKIISIKTAEFICWFSQEFRILQYIPEYLEEEPECAYQR